MDRVVLGHLRTSADSALRQALISGFAIEYISGYSILAQVSESDQLVDVDLQVFEGRRVIERNHAVFPIQSESPHG